MIVRGLVVRLKVLLQLFASGQRLEAHHHSVTPKTPLINARALALLFRSDTGTATIAGLKGNFFKAKLS